MATAVGKTPPKPPMEKKESTPKTENNSGNSENKDAGNKGKIENRPPRENRFQNRGGGRGRFPYQKRGGFSSRDNDRDSGNMNSGQSGNMSGDFYGEQNDGPKEQKKFTGRCRLFVGNITPDTTEEQFKEMFTPYGEVSEVFVNAARGFGFIRLDYRINAEKAKIELDGQMRNNRVLRVRFATHGAALKVHNLSSFVSNELLEKAFSQFGEVERAVVCVDDRGRSCGEGLVEFARKPGAQAALKRINEGVFLLSAYPRPIRVEMLEQRDEEDGLTEKFVQRNDGFRQDREKEPRFAPPGSFEFEFGNKYRRIDEMEKEKTDRVKREMDVERQRLAEEMETAVFDFQADQIRQDLLRQQEELKRLDELKNEHMRRRQEMDIRRMEQMRGSDHIMRQEEERRREMMMRASDAINREREGGMNQGPPNRGPGGGRSDDMMRGPGGIHDRDGSRNEPRGGPNTPPMPMAPPPVPPGVKMDENRSGGSREGSRFSEMRDSPGSMDRGMDRSRMDRGGHDGMKDSPSSMRPGPVGPPGGRFPGPGGPSGQGNFHQGPGGMGNRFPIMPPGGPMGRGDRRDGPHRDEFEAKRMRRF